MKKQLLALFLLANTALWAQPAIEWHRTLGGSALDVGSSFCVASDGGYVFAGYTNSNDGDVSGNHGSSDAWVIKLDTNGNTVWKKTYGGSSGETITMVKPTADGGYILSGSTGSNDGNVSGNHGEEDIWMVKLDVSGDMAWQKCIGGTAGEEASSVIATADGGYLVTAVSKSADGDFSENDTVYGDWWAIKTDGSGNIEWKTRQIGNEVEPPIFSANTIDGGYIITGFTSSVLLGVVGDDIQGLVTKLDAQGNIEWSRLYGGSAPDYLYGVLPLADGSFLIAGQTESADGDLSENSGASDGWLLKLDAYGDIIQSQSYGNPVDDPFVAVVQAADGGFVVGGSSYSWIGGDFSGHHGLTDGIVVKFDAGLNIQWQKPIGGTNQDMANWTAFAPDGSIVSVGVTESNDGDASDNHGGGGDLWVVKMEPEPLATQQFVKAALQLYPNPASSQLHIQLPDGKTANQIIVNDLTGKTVLSGSGEMIPVVDLSAGMYFIEVMSGSQKYQAKFIKQ